jgi:thioredoxin-related protein
LGAGSLRRRALAGYLAGAVLGGGTASALHAGHRFSIPLPITFPDAALSLKCEDEIGDALQADPSAPALTTPIESRSGLAAGYADPSAPERHLTTQLRKLARRARVESDSAPRDAAVGRVAMAPLGQHNRGVSQAGVATMNIARTGRSPSPRRGWPGLLLLALLMAVGAAQAAATRDPGQYFFDQTFGDFGEELATARDEDKQGILLMFEMDECPFCHRMKNTVLNQPSVQDYFKEHFLVFSVDVEGDVEVTDFTGEAMAQKDFALKSHRVRATPVFAFFDLDGNLVARYTGATRDTDEFLLLGRYVVEGAYKNTTFTKYKREHADKSAAADGQAAR